jgi:hypothetical protein
LAGSVQTVDFFVTINAIGTGRESEAQAVGGAAGKLCDMSRHGPLLQGGLWAALQEVSAHEVAIFHIIDSALKF